VISPNQTTEVDAGSTVAFACVAYGDPNPSITWKKGDTDLVNDSRVSIFDELFTENEVTFTKSILGLCNAEASDAGQYSCFADNTLGNETAAFTLTVDAHGNTIIKSDASSTAAYLLGTSVLFYRSTPSCDFFWELHRGSWNYCIACLCGVW